MSDKPFDQEISDHDIEDFNKNIMAKIKEYNELNELAMHKMQLSRYQKYADTYSHPLLSFKDYLYLVDQLGEFNKHHLYVIQEYLNHPALTLDELFKELEAKHGVPYLSDAEYYTNQLEMFAILSKDPATGHANIDLKITADEVDKFYNDYMSRINSYHYDPSLVDEAYKKMKYRE